VKRIKFNDLILIFVQLGITILLGYLFGLPYQYLSILFLLSVLLTPFFIHFQISWNKEESEFYELTDFLQQFLVSFKQHPKIYASLLECSENTHNQLNEQIKHWIIGIETGGHPKQFADEFVRVQSHFIVSNLIHLMLAVEKYGTFNYHEGLEIIQDDIEDWIEDTTLFKGEQISTRNRIQILAVFACGIAWMSHNMLFRTELIETMDFYYFSLFVFLVLILLTLFFSQKIISVPWIERSEKLWES
jgi:hypothetical protein